MTKVYIVIETSNDYEAHSTIMGVFSTKEKADAEVKILQPKAMHGKFTVATYDVEEYIVN